MGSRLPEGVLRPVQQQLEERDVQRQVQRLLQALQLRPSRHRPGHPPHLPLLRHHDQPAQRQAQVPVGRRQTFRILLRSCRQRCICSATTLNSACQQICSCADALDAELAAMEEGLGLTLNWTNEAITAPRRSS
ncbi:uncharacterized protein LOC124682758 isoform X1 [Lolium rigidum]|uniref:uncharacterized protein LOC124682758 isoform X1 n=1 Tax=Lolium rigidum TaxID=89674 RepID=UPI001F5D5319|nr:uncharacterized protein LOC124682758 isoform X1 [Lolium rigidum]